MKMTEEQKNRIKNRALLFFAGRGNKHKDNPDLFAISTDYARSVIGRIAIKEGVRGLSTQERTNLWKETRHEFLRERKHGVKGSCSGYEPHFRACLLLNSKEELEKIVPTPKEIEIQSLGLSPKNESVLRALILLAQSKGEKGWKNRILIDWIISHKRLPVFADFGFRKARNGLEYASSRELPNLTREERDLLFPKEDFLEFDVENAVPTALLMEANLAGLPCPFLTAYVSRRDLILTSLGDKSLGKESLLKVIYGGRRFAPEIERNAFFQGFQKEVHSLVDAVIKRNTRGGVITNATGAKMKPSKNRFRNLAFILLAPIGQVQQMVKSEMKDALVFMAVDGFWIRKDKKNPKEQVERIKKLQATIQRGLGLNLRKK